MTIFPNGSRAAINGTSTGYFTGQVRIDPVFDAEGAARASVGHVTFEPGARTKWHTHPIGQLLIVSQGSGYVCKAGEAPQPIRARRSCTVCINTPRALRLRGKPQ